MRLTAFTDYAFRLLMMVEASPDSLVTIEQAARRYAISRTHLMKIANLLTRAGFLQAVRGRGGGLRLARRPEDIRLGEVVRASEPDFGLVECFLTGNACAITGVCRLPPILSKATAAFLETLDGYTLADLSLTGSSGRREGLPEDGVALPSLLRTVGKSSA